MEEDRQALEVGVAGVLQVLGAPVILTVRGVVIPQQVLVQIGLMLEESQLDRGLSRSQLVKKYPESYQ